CRASCKARLVEEQSLSASIPIWRVFCSAISNSWSQEYLGEEGLMLSNIWNDLRIGARAISGRPTFAVVVMLTLALGIGVNIAVYSLAEESLLRELPVPEPERLVNLVDREPRIFARMDPELIPFALPSDNGGPGTVF